LDLEEYGRKHDYRFSHEESGREADAAVRAARALAGSWFDVPRGARTAVEPLGETAQTREEGNHEQERKTGRRAETREDQATPNPAVAEKGKKLKKEFVKNERPAGRPVRRLGGQGVVRRELWCRA
jgi:hypothetical protein